MKEITFLVNKLYIEGKITIVQRAEILNVIDQLIIKEKKHETPTSKNS